MATIVITSTGTLGDYLPLLVLGRALADRGHDVRAAVNEVAHPYARGLGLEPLPCGRPFGPEEARAVPHVFDHWRPPVEPESHALERTDLAGHVRDLLAACAGADLLVAGSIQGAAPIVHERTGIPWVGAVVMPADLANREPGASETAAAAAAGPPSRFPGWFDGVRAAFGLGPLTAEALAAYFRPARRLLLSSPLFSLPATPPRGDLRQTGFLFYRDPAAGDGAPADAGLRAFVEEGDPPLVLSFSSLTVADRRAVAAVHAGAAARLGRKLLIQGGWAGFDAADLAEAGAPPGLVRAAPGYLSHDWLFPRAAAAIVHGGIGTVARALRAGLPLLVEPMGNDQSFNATRVVELGAGAALAPHGLTAEAVAETLATHVLPAAIRTNVRAFGERLAAERPEEAACAAIEAWLAADGRGPRTAAPARRPIPRMIHQSWKTADVPEPFRALQATWREHNPGFEVRLWTDDDNRALVRDHYPWFLPIYDRYIEPIKRADAARCFVLHRLGGVYADLDFECLRPIEPLLDGREVVLGLEPAPHLDLHFPRERLLERIVCNAFMASTPGHPFWEHAFCWLVAQSGMRGPLDATGPFLLTRACDTYAEKERLFITGADLLYPVTGAESEAGLLRDPAVRARLRETAFAVHHWSGTWWREPAGDAATPPPPPPPAGDARPALPVRLLVGGRFVGASELDPHVAGDLAREEPRPLVSALMVTRGRPALAARAIRCFQAQTYPARELVIVDDDEDGALAGAVAALGDPRVRHVRLAPGGLTLGELRDRAVAAAAGAYVCQWDDDDLSDPARIELQLGAVRALRAEACFLQRETLWWPAERRLALSTRRLWEGSFLCAKDAMPGYPPLRRGEDTPVAIAILRSARVAILDRPDLYVHVVHGRNTFETAHFEEHWAAATERYAGAAYDEVLAAIAARVPVDGGAERGLEFASVGRDPNNGQTLSQESVVNIDKPDPSGRPSVLILTPVKDAAPHLPRYFENLRALRYPHDRISLAFLDSDSRDGTAAALAAHLRGLDGDFRRTAAFRRDYGFRSALPRWDPRIQRERRGVLARSRNFLLASALRDEDWVLWLDVDVASYPADLIERLLALGKDIVVPHCVVAPGGSTFDLNTFQLAPDAAGRDWSPYVVDGILQPPRGEGRRYLGDLRAEGPLVRVDGVGATALLVRADLHREGLIFPAAPYKLHIETEGLALLARDMGHECFGATEIEVVHP